MKKLIVILCIPLFLLCISLFYIEVSLFSVDPSTSFWEKFKYVWYKSPLFYVTFVLIVLFFLAIKKK